MKKWKFIVSPVFLINALIALFVGLLAINHQPLLAETIVIGDQAWRWWHQKQRNLAFIQNDGWLWITGISGIVVITLTPNLVSQGLLAVAYGIWRWWLLVRFNETNQLALGLAAVTQAVALWAIFLAAAVWHWPTIVILVAVWLVSWTIGLKVLAGTNDRATAALALTWAMIVAECSWVFSLWLVNYIVFGGILLIPQPAIVISALGYCLAGIYTSHRQSQLTRRRLVEYLVIGLVILIFVIGGTKWNGVI